MISRCRHPAPLPPKYSKSSRSPASTFPHSTQLLLDCLSLALLVSNSPRRDYFQTFAHGKFHYWPSRSNSAAAVTSCGDSLSRTGKPLGLQIGTLTRLVNTRRSNRHNSPLSTVSVLQQFLTPECLYFFTPATSLRQSESSSLLQQFSRQSESSSLLQQFLTPERIFFFTSAIPYARANLLLYSSNSHARANLLLYSSNSLRQSESSYLDQQFRRFLLFSLFLVV